MKSKRAAFLNLHEAARGQLVDTGVTIHGFPVMVPAGGSVAVILDSGERSPARNTVQAQRTFLKERVRGG